MVGPDGAARDEPRGEFAEGHRGIGFDDLEALVVEFLLELVFDLFCLLAVGGSGRILVADAVSVEIDPPDVSALEETQAIPPFCCCRSASE